MKRLDVLVFERGIAESRTSAHDLIINGAISLNGRITLKPSEKAGENDEIKLVGKAPKFVSRGGYKLETALDVFNINLSGMVCLDIGASTGGFTDCMLQRGAVRVYALDVGTGQLSEHLRNDKRVISMEKTDVRTAIIDEKIDFITVDVSFISLKLILPLLGKFMKNNGTACVLIKPQFEIGKMHLKNGVLRDRKKQMTVVEDIEQIIKNLGYTVIGTVKSKLSGRDGNEEFLAYFKYTEGE